MYLTFSSHCICRYNIGVREGATADSQQSLQSGFTQGVNDSFQRMINLGRLRGKLCALLTLHAEHTDTDTNKDLVERLGLLEHRLKQGMMDCSIGDPASLTLDAESAPSTKLQTEMDELMLLINNCISQTLSSCHQID